MKRTAWVTLVVTISIAIAALVVIGKSALNLGDVVQVSDRIAYYKLHVDLAEAVLVGFGAALLAILIPAIFTETRLSFERLKDSRTAYSEAKTGMDYLPLRLCTLELKDAAALVQQLHVRKHEAELFQELEIHLKRRGIDKTPAQWADGLYAKLFAVRTLLETNAGKWDALSPDKRLKLLRSILPAMEMESTVPGAFSPEEIRLEKIIKSEDAR